jgi:hypothetical protein
MKRRDVRQEVGDGVHTRSAPLLHARADPSMMDGRGQSPRGIGP